MQPRAAPGVHTSACETAEITVVVPTMANTERRASLLRALKSIGQASDRPVNVLIVVNGQRWAQEVIDEAGALPQVHCLQISEGSLPKALAHGRAAVDTPYFAFLDDDDELTSGALDARLRIMEADGACDVVVTNGWRELQGQRTRAMRNLTSVEADPLEALFVENWLASCGGLYRTASIPQAYFDDPHDFAEWTWLAYCLALDRKKVRVIDVETFVIHDSVVSRSKSDAYRASYKRLFERMLERMPPPAVRRRVSAKLGEALHDLSDEALARREVVAAWRLHVGSLMQTGGGRYLAYSRHILRALVRRRVDT